MTEISLRVGLSNWIILDKNYDDFESGDIARFALEFHFPERPVPAPPNETPPQLTPLTGATYDACGIVRYVHPEVWIVDFGTVLAFDNGKAPKGVAVGDKVSGRVFLGVDPFFYFNGHYSLPRIPPLIYEWQVAGIEIECGPIIDGPEIMGRKSMMRDPSRIEYLPVPRTNARGDGHFASYVLTCRRLKNPPTWRPHCT